MVVWDFRRELTMSLNGSVGGLGAQSVGPVLELVR